MHRWRSAPRGERGGARDLFRDLFSEDLFSEVNAQLVGKAMTWPYKTIDGICDEDYFQQHLRQLYPHITPSLLAKLSSSSARGRTVTPLRDVWRRSGRLRPDASRHPSPSRTRKARPKMYVPGEALLAQARRSRAAALPNVHFRNSPHCSERWAPHPPRGARRPLPAARVEVKLGVDFK